MGRGCRDIVQGRTVARRACLPLLALSLLAASGPANAQMQDPSPWSTCAAPDSLTRALERIARRVGDEIGIAATRVPVEENHFLGCVAYFPERYPDIAISVAADVLEGVPVPQEVHSAHIFLDELHRRPAPPQSTRVPSISKSTRRLPMGRILLR